MSDDPAVRAPSAEAAAVLVAIRVAAPPRPSRAGPDQVELAADALWARGAIAVETRPDAEGTTLLAGYPTPAAAQAVAATLALDWGATVEEVTDDSWREAWRDWVHPTPVGRGLLVVPSWRQVTVDTGRTRIEIDPGPCFGSGTHASTRMILAWLDANRPSGLRVTDVGCGSGILAVTAARLGAVEVIAVDIDAGAVAVTRRNAERNGVAARMRASATPVGDLAAASADLVVVNVTAGAHATIGPACARLVRPGGGKVVVAGLLPGQWEHVGTAYLPLRPEEHLELDGWRGAVLASPSHDPGRPGA